MQGVKRAGDSRVYARLKTSPAATHPLPSVLSVTDTFEPLAGSLRSNLDPWGGFGDGKLWEALRAAQMAGVVTALGGLDARMQVRVLCGGGETGKSKQREEDVM